MLHMLINSPFHCNINLLAKMISVDDDFIALQDGVLISVQNNIFLKKLHFPLIEKLYVLREDIIARGLSLHISSLFSVVNYNYFINLTVKHNKQINW
ncbi:Protein TusB [Buchnera aphidicola (Eriosoma lanigerum)]|uniref:sulfurtransferase complex subunit TusB n=1 Tax=Buchnera aphidicola TaxID=9 RepID=UPI003463BB36